MYQIYNVIDKKSNIEGFWVDNEGKLYRDNIEIINSLYPNKIIKNLFIKGEKAVFTVKKEKSLFDIQTEKANVLYANGKKEQLTNKKVYYIRKNEQLKNKIVSFCKKFGGCTVYYNGKKTVRIEVWS